MTTIRINFDRPDLFDYFMKDNEKWRPAGDRLAAFMDLEDNIHVMPMDALQKIGVKKITVIAG